METLWSDFINSEWHDWKGGGRSEDRLEKPSWQSGFLNDWRLRAPVPAADDDIAAMREFREKLHALAVELAGGGEIGEEAWQLLNQYMKPGTVYREFAADREGTVKLEYRPAMAEWRQVLAEVAASFGQTVLQGRPDASAFATTRTAGGYFMTIRGIGRRNTATTKCAAI